MKAAAMKLSSKLCPRYQAAIDLLGKRWTGLILRVLIGEPRRFGELATQIEVVSERMLSERLKELEAEGVVTRRVLPGPPVGVEYALTNKGRALEGVIGEIGRWAEAWLEAPKPSAAKPAARRNGARP